MNTTIWEKLKELYDKTPIKLEDDLVEYARTGYVYITPGFAIIGRRIGDGWYVQAAVGVGSLEEFAKLMPYSLPYIGWRREGKHNNECVWYRTETVLRKIKYARIRTNTTGTSSTS